DVGSAERSDVRNRPRGRHGRRIGAEPVDEHLAPVPSRTAHVPADVLPEGSNTTPDRVRGRDDLAAAGRNDLAAIGVQRVHPLDPVWAAEIIGLLDHPFERVREGDVVPGFGRWRVPLASDEGGNQREREADLSAQWDGPVYSPGDTRPSAIEPTPVKSTPR